MQKYHLDCDNCDHMLIFISQGIFWLQSARYDDTKQDERNVLLFLQKHPQMKMIKTVVHHHSEKHHALNLNEIFNWSQKLPSA